jgi:outer membrane protein OmpA-like peptidoglycan-associated protein
VTKQENKSVKAEVLTRIDLMPNVSSSDKDKLYNAVERARSMGKILTIPFGSGKTELSAADIEQLKAELDKPEIQKLRGDPTAVFVILGYADPKGDAKKNIAISQTRADTVLKQMREKCSVINVMHPVAMGGSKLLDAQNLEKNRIVEIWAVLP